MTRRALDVWINQTRVGALSEDAGIWRFRYQSSWLDTPDAYPLCPALPLQVAQIEDSGSQRPVQWYFDNLLPEEGQRRLLAADANVDAADAFSLLVWYGAESAGSLTLLPSGSAAPTTQGLATLPDAALSARIQKMRAVPLTHDAVKRMSLAGAQHKLAVVMRDAALFEPKGTQPSTHILKPDHPDPDYPHSVVNEWFVMTLAQRMGLDAPRVARRYVPEPVYLIERFDRYVDAHGTHRRHAIDACQLLGLDRSFKYAQGSVQTLAQLAAACRNKAQTRVRLYNWLVFNVLTGNGDAHLKNLSFLVGADGVHLAPHYDLLCTACYEALLFGQHGWPRQTTLAWPILDTRRFAEVNRTLLLQAADAIGIRPAQADRLLAWQRDRILTQADQLLRDVEVENRALLVQAPALAATFAGEMRCLRGICHVVIQEMVRALRSGA